VVKIANFFWQCNITVYNCSIYKNTASIGVNIVAVHMPLGNSVTVHIMQSQPVFLEEKELAKVGDLS